jgi:hypothetical protein
VTAQPVDHKLEEVIEPACRVIARGEIFSISVVPGWPFEPAEVLRLTSYAADRGISLSIDGADVIILRKGQPIAPVVPSFQWRGLLRWLRVGAAPARLTPVAGHAR